jgi:hypothetical protein
MKTTTMRMRRIVLTTKADEILCFSNDPEHRVLGMVGDEVLTPSTTRVTCPVYRRMLWACVNR